MICLRCNAENSEEAKFCKNCGMDMSYTPPTKNDTLKQSVLFLLIVLGWHYAMFILWEAINFYVRKLTTSGGNNTEVLTIYKVANWFGTGSTVILMLILAIISKNNSLRIALIIFILIRIALNFSYLLTS